MKVIFSEKRGGTGKIDKRGAWPVVIEPGELLSFSGAHLHASIPNNTDVVRFNLETRTVCLDDLLENRGAPDIDHAAPRHPTGWFVRIDDGAPLSAMVG